ncbi:hypothetical protein DQ238_01265 [Geodermatophilus sp. TF02-6]|uniref:hypothetical protein n=1 Tax=Geodermatophilus sp. TF02-6 TaxID=2250575 RepID=UPI000DEB4196|nr:hypothetical protein [Geodermatophilus sp. TF02-6]RBY83736.1 hypothetical protein DQ238_01265 [Geodermatophilus sp. TF02-6]
MSTTGEFGQVETTGLVPLPHGEPAEIGVVRPAAGDDGPPLVVAVVPEDPMTAATARRLAGGLLLAAARADGLLLPAARAGGLVGDPGTAADAQRRRRWALPFCAAARAAFSRRRADG